MKYSLVSLLILLRVAGCEKDYTPDNCAAIQHVRIKVEKDSFYVGDEIRLGINEQPSIAMFNWAHDNQPNISGATEVQIGSAQKSDEGWYYLNVSYPDCASHYDSVYIHVLNRPASAPCNPASNTVTFSSIPGINAATVTWSFDPGWNRKVMTVRGPVGYPDVNIYFNAYWNDKEPEDGEYSITSMMATGNYPPYTVYISSLYSSTLFEAGTGKVYVSHVNGKLQVTFCNIPFSGSTGGSSYNTTASGRLTAP